MDEMSKSDSVDSSTKSNLAQVGYLSEPFCRNTIVSRKGFLQVRNDLKKHVTNYCYSTEGMCQSDCMLVI